MIWDKYYKQSHHRLAEYLIGIISGYLMYSINNNGKPLKVSKFISWGGWMLSSTFMIYHVFYEPKKDLSSFGVNLYDSISREAWTCCICWMIFACHYLQSGGFVRTILSHPFWQPLSKMCLSIYLIHFLYIALTVANRKQNIYFEIWWQLHIHVGDIFISIILSGIFYTLIEAPTAKVLGILWICNQSQKPIEEKKLTTS